MGRAGRDAGATHDEDGHGEHDDVQLEHALLVLLLVDFFPVLVAELLLAGAEAQEPREQQGAGRRREGGHELCGRGAMRRAAAAAFLRAIAGGRAPRVREGRPCAARPRDPAPARRLGSADLSGAATPGVGEARRGSRRRRCPQGSSEVCGKGLTYKIPSPGVMDGNLTTPFAPPPPPSRPPPPIPRPRRSTTAPRATTCARTVAENVPLPASAPISVSGATCRRPTAPRHGLRAQASVPASKGA